MVRGSSRARLDSLTGRHFETLLLVQGTRFVPLRISSLVLAFWLATCVLCASAFSQWSTTTTDNNVVSAATGSQTLPVIASDGAGGAIIAWRDTRNGSNYDIYAQRINASGEVQWTTDGVAISTAPYDQDVPVIISDDSGGAIIAWSDRRSSTEYDVYAQRINGAGAVQWTADGVAISTAPHAQSDPDIVTDGAGGAIIAWRDFRSSTSYDIYAQRINAAGAVQWTADGVVISTASGLQFPPKITSDSAGGAIITWYDYRGSNEDIYAQRINASGVVQWTANGVAICTATNHQTLPIIVSDGSGGAIIAWRDYRSGSNYDIYARRINAQGSVQWTANGVGIVTAANSQIYPAMVSDGSGGAIVTWQDYRSGTNLDIYAQRIDSAGVLQWTTDGVPVSTAEDDQSIPAVTTDGAGGAIITWYDHRNFVNQDIYAQHVNAAGEVLWSGDGVAVSTADRDQVNPVIVRDNYGGAIITWSDFRNGANYDIYAQWVDEHGHPGGTPPLTISPPTLDFGEVKVGSSKSDSVLLTNNSRAQLIVTSVTSTDPDFHDFVQAETLGVSSSKYYTITFTPTTEDSRNAGSIFYHNASTSPDTVLVSGSGVAPHFSVTPLSLAFGIVPPDSLKFDSLLVRNEGTASLQIDSVVSTTPDLTCVPTSAVVAPADSQRFYLTFHPMSQYGARADTIQFFHDAAGSPGLVVCTARNEVSLDFPVNQYWNMVSLPLTMVESSKVALFPTATSNAFAYESSYVVKPSMSNGVGYWLKFDSAQTIPMSGLVRNIDTITVHRGWNLVGSISSTIPVGKIMSDTGGVVTSRFFGYNEGYYLASAIEPGKGYWVKVSQESKLILSATDTANTLNRIKIVPSEELPPPAPQDDAPVLPETKHDRSGLIQSFPNPFNPTTEFGFRISDFGLVTLKVFDALGREVATLVNESKQPGEYKVSWSAKNLPTGVYYYRLQARNYTETKKVILLR